MSFLSAVFLWGLPLLAVPVAIHLFSRRRQETVRWGAMQFLEQSSIRRRKIWRIDDLVLMAVRALALAALVFALARPIWHGSQLAGGAGRDVIMIWDVSLSMGRIQQDKTSFQRLLDETEKFFARLGPTDTLRGLTCVGRGDWIAAEPLPATEDWKRGLLERLKQVGVTEASADWFACLNTALGTETPQQQRARFVVIVTDGQSIGWNEDDPAIWQSLTERLRQSPVPTAIEVYNVAAGAEKIDNLSIDRLSTARQLLGVGEPFLVEAEIRNHGEFPLAQGALAWSQDDAPLGKSTIGPLAPGQVAKTTFQFPGGKGGPHRIACRLERADDLPDDNEQSLILEAIDHVPILIVDDTQETDPLKTDQGYLLAALGQDPSGAVNAAGTGVFRADVVSVEKLADETLSKYRCVVFPNTPPLNESLLEKLTDAVRQGIGLWLCLGDQTQPLEFNRQFYRTGAGLAPCPISAPEGDLIRREEFLTIHPPVQEHAATSLLSDTARLDIDRVKIYQHIPFAVAQSRTTLPVLLESGTGEPLVVEGSLGRGRVVLQSVPLGVAWSNLPLTQVYVPLVHEWLWYLVQPTSAARTLQPGEPLRIALPANEHIQQVVLQSPHGPPANLVPFSQGDRWWAQSRHTQLPGTYEATIQIEGKPDDLQPYQVLRTPDESNLTPWAEGTEAFAQGVGLLRINPAGPLEMPVGTTGIRAGEPVWSTLLALAALLLLIEIGLVRHIATQRMAFRLEGTTAQSPWTRGLLSLLTAGRSR